MTKPGLLKNLSPAAKTFVSAVLILLAMVIMTGGLTFIVPNGDYDVQTGTYTLLDHQGMPLYKLFLSPILVLGSDSGVLIIAILLFLFIISGAIHVLKETNLIENAIQIVIGRFGQNEALLQAALIFFFMALGAFVGVFEEVIPLVPLMLMLSEKMNWDVLTGLGLSILATGLGFAAAITNPFTIGVAQQLAGIPLFSGALLRIFIFISVYAVFTAFMLYRTAKVKAKTKQASIDRTSAGKIKVSPLNLSSRDLKAMRFFAITMGAMLILIFSTTILPVLRDLSLPLIAVIFLVAAFGVGQIVRGQILWTSKMLLAGMGGMLPAVLLVLLASSVKYILVEGHLLGTLLFYASNFMQNASPLQGLFYAFFIVMALNFFIGSGSAKAFILMPILMPLMDIMGVSRQMGILAFQFGDGFSNVLYPTNAVLLIALGLSRVSYGKWLRFILPLQIVLMVLSLAWLALGYAVGYGL